jgi:hypothetical protein
VDKLVDILKKEAVTLSQEFEKASALGAGTPQEVADFRENAFRTFLRRFYPNPYRVVKGKIHDSYSEGGSASIDCILINPVHPNLIDTQEKFQLILADGVDAAIEIKPDLANHNELIRGLKQGISVKLLRRIKGPILVERGKPYHVVEASRQIPFFLFTQKAKATLKDTVSEIQDWYIKESVPTENQVDAIAVQGIGILNNIKHQDFYNYGWQIPENDRVGWFLEKWGEATLAGFLLRIEMSFQSMATVQESILRRYLKGLKIEDLERITI